MFGLLIKNSANNRNNTNFFTAGETCGTLFTTQIF